MTFKIKISGSRNDMRADYECPVHGRFEATVQRDENGDPPSAQNCPHLAPDVANRNTLCGRQAEYRFCAPLTRVNPIEAVKGKWTKPERPTYTDTRNLGEGQPLNDWREDRAKVWEEKRKQDVVEFARMHNERVIGHD